MAKKAYSDNFKEQIVDLYYNGKSVNDLAAEYGISKAAIYNWVNELTDNDIILEFIVV